MDLGFSFQENSFSTDTYIISDWNKEWTNITQITMCFASYLLFASKIAETYFSSITESSEGLFIGSSWTNQEFYVHWHDQTIHATFQAKIHLRNWHRICVGVDLKKNAITFIQDGETFEWQPKQILVPPRLVKFIIGQRVNPLGKIQDRHQSFSGKLVDFLILDNIPRSSWLQNYTKCMNYSATKNIIFSWSSGFSIDKEGDVSSISMKKDETCPSSYEFLIPVKMTFSEATNMCKTLRGNMIHPKSSAHFQKLHERFSKFVDVCDVHRMHVFWVPNMKNPERNSSHTSYNSNANFFHGLDNLPSSDELCLASTGPGLTETTTVKCNETFCPLCAFENAPHITMRGLCKDIDIDRTWYIAGYDGVNLVLYGHFNGRMGYQSKEWSLESRFNENLTVLCSETLSPSLPLGQHHCRIQGGQCPEEKISALFNTCHKNEITCKGSGECLPRNKRCDGVADCPSGSDENTCRMISTVSGYSSQISPSLSTSQKTFGVELTINLTAVSCFNIETFLVTLEAVLIFEWRDSRIQFINLQDEQHVNMVENSSEIWKPELYIETDSFTPVTVTTKFQQITVKKESESIPRDEFSIVEDDIYQGSQNSFFLKQKVSMTFSCSFELEKYPFDTQECILFLTLQGTSKNTYFTMGRSGVSFIGRRKLLEYRLIKESAENYTYDGYDAQKVSLKFKNMYGYYVGNVLVPTLLLTVICYLVLFFDVTDFQDRIMVSLTSMLVLSSLFSQTTDMIPRTSYMKLIDIWFLSLIGINFVIIIFVVTIEALRLRNQDQKTSFVADRSSGYQKNSEVNIKKINALFKIILPIIICGYLGWFFSYIN